MGLRGQPSSALRTFAANSSVWPFNRDRRKLSTIRASGPLDWTAMVYVTFVPFSAGAKSIVPVISMLSAAPRNLPWFRGIWSVVSVRTWMSLVSGPILTCKFHRARLSSRTSTDCTPGTQLPTFRMSLRNAHTRSTGASTSNEIVPSGIASPAMRCLGNTLQHAGCDRCAPVAREGVEFSNNTPIRKGAEVLPHFASAGGVREVDSTFPEKRKARALVHADLPILRHFVHRFAAFRFPLAAEVDRHFRSLLQFHVSRVQRPSLVRVRHV